MIITDFPRDLLMTGAIFGVAAFVWAGWAQERPPKHWIWRVILAVLGLGGAALAGISLPAAIRNWSEPTAISVGTPAFIVYIVVFWLEVAAMIALAIWASRKKRQDLIPVFVLAVVGIHFVPLAWVFVQPMYALVGMVLTGLAVLIGRMNETPIARSFWCGLTAAPVLLVAGIACAVAGFGALGD
ncbi:hypothetical protein [Microbacterium murale]|nr:hypothetical protein [Microbacterium murale]